MKDKVTALRKIRSVADYQFGKGVGAKIFPDEVEISYSKRTGRIRHIRLGGRLLATLRPRDGLFSLTVAGAKRLWETVKSKRLWVKVQDDVAPFIAEGKSVFAKHVVAADEEIRPREEVVVVNEKNVVVAVGKAMLSGGEIMAFKTGVAVRVRRGAAEEN